MFDMWYICFTTDRPYVYQSISEVYQIDFTNGIGDDFMNYRIIAVDFDGTLCYSNWPELGEPNMPLIEYLRAQKKSGNKLILWTCRVGEALENAVSWCRELHLEFDAVNDNLPEIIEKYGNNSRKITCDYYIDDKAVLPEAVRACG